MAFDAIGNFAADDDVDGTGRHAAVGALVYIVPCKLFRRHSARSWQHVSVRQYVLLEHSCVLVSKNDPAKPEGAGTKTGDATTAAQFQQCLQPEANTSTLLRLMLAAYRAAAYLSSERRLVLPQKFDEHEGSIPNDTCIHCIFRRALCDAQGRASNATDFQSTHPCHGFTPAGALGKMELGK
jgi:hypothetical protein